MNVRYDAVTGLFRRIATFFRDPCGTTAVEFGFVAVPFLGIVLFAVQASINALTLHALETLNQSSSRQIMTGSVQQQSMNAAQYKAQVCAQLPTLMQCSQLYVDVRAVAQIQNADTTYPALTFDGTGNVTNPWVYLPGNPGDIVTVKMMYVTIPVPTLLGSLANQTNNARMIMSTAVFKSEPYGN